MSEEWHKYVKILEREDQEFKTAMWEEVSITSIHFYFSLNLVVNNRIFAGAGIIAQCEKELSNLQEMFSSFILQMLHNFVEVWYSLEQYIGL